MRGEKGDRAKDFFFFLNKKKRRREELIAVF